jgi:hypothetical protein
MATSIDKKCTHAWKRVEWLPHIWAWWMQQGAKSLSAEDICWRRTVPMFRNQVLRNAGTPLLCGLFGLHTSAPSSSTATSANETPVSLIADHCISLHTHLSHPIVACWKQRPHDGFMAHLGSIPHDHGSSVASCSAMKNSPSCTNLCYVLVAKRTINSLYDFEWATHLFRELNWIVASRINSQKMATTSFFCAK